MNTETKIINGEIDPLHLRLYAEVELSAAKNNFIAIKKHLSRDTKLCCVVKANAYGHGSTMLSRLYEEWGADFFAVSNIEEGLQIRKAGVKAPILILGYTHPALAGTLAKEKLTQTVYSTEYASMLSSSAVEKSVDVEIHIKLDTGMGRIGFRCIGHEDNFETDEIIKACRLPRLIPKGIFSHLAQADEGKDGEEYTKAQFNAFMREIELLKEAGISFETRHIANSAALTDYPFLSLDMVRAGIVLYGLYPSKKIKNDLGILPLMSLKSTVSNVKVAKEGDRISYGGEYICPRDTVLATVPIGYADGFFRSNYKNGGSFIINGHNCPIVGRVCMDQTMVLCEGFIPKIGDPVTVFGTGELTADVLAKRDSTINYEIISDIGIRVPRVYTENGVPMFVSDYLL